MRLFSLLSCSLSLATAAVIPRSPGYGDDNDNSTSKKFNVELGPRPEYLINNMDEGPLKEKMKSCSEGPFKSSDFAFSHRGAPLQFPEHTVEGYTAARRMGAGVIECDVAFTKDKQLVCRHAQCDLHTTTNILNTTLASKCTTPFTPAGNGSEANAKCCTSDITVDEFKSLCGKMDGFNAKATTVAEYMDGTPNFRSDLYSTCGTLQTLPEYIALVDGWGLKFTPELKAPEVPMPFNGYTQELYSQDMTNAFKDAGIDASRVWVQSSQESDILYWIENEPEFAQQALYIDGRVVTAAGYANATATMGDLAAKGFKILAPPIFGLIKVDNETNMIVASEYAVAAKEAGLELATWSLERSGWLNTGGDAFYASVHSVINNDGDMYTVLDALVKKVGVKYMFSDWAATITYYASCFGL